jgi:hypothetical protein
MACNYNHVAFLVADMNAAITKFSHIFNIEFNQPSLRQSNMQRKGVRTTEQVLVTYSKTEPYIELIEGTESGYFAISQGEGFHHIGLWAPSHDCSLWQELYGELGIDAQLMSGEEPTTTLTDPASSHGVRVEIVDERKRPAIEAWIKGEAG